MPLSCPVYSPAERGSKGGGERLNLPGLEKTEQAAALQQRTLPLGVGVSAVQSKKRLGQECKFRYLSIKIKYYNRSNVPHQINTLCWYLSEKMSFFSVL